MPAPVEVPSVRVRFAPSPTGYVHVGNARTALFNWLFARHHGGAFVLRIEDTDAQRSEERYETHLIDNLRWFGLDWDEGPDKPEKGGAPGLHLHGQYGPYRQSERLEIYSRFTCELMAQGHAYYCFCSPEQLEAERQEALKVGKQPRYSGRCRNLPAEESARRVAKGELAAVRLKISDESFNWRDLIHGPTNFSGDVIGDPVLVRSDGNPAYNYAVVIDDHLMKITHVIRGDDHISNTPRQLAVYRALGWEPPAFGHLSTILGPDRTRLSKRHGATSLESFREMGVLPEALRNYLALLGWSPADGKTEILSGSELTAQFSLDHITRSPAVFDIAKLYWLNRHYMKEAPVSGLAKMSIPFLASAGYVSSTAGAGCVGGAAPEPDPFLQWLGRVVEAVRKNLDFLSQIPAATRLVFDYDALAREEDARRLVEDPDAMRVLRVFIPKILALDIVTYENFRAAVKSAQDETGKKGRELFHPIRVALTGAASGPELEKLIPIFEEGSKLPLLRHVKSCAERLRDFQKIAGIC
ncbi:MAG: glutamate--tRNA ligase [Terriglobia bacterium]